MITPAADMKAAYTPGEVTHSAATKNATSAPATPICSAVSSGQARQTAAAKAAANIRRPTSGVGGERSRKLSVTQPLFANQTRNNASTAKSASHTYAAR